MPVQMYTYYNIIHKVGNASHEGKGHNLLSISFDSTILNACTLAVFASIAGREPVSLSWKRNYWKWKKLTICEQRPLETIIHVV